MAVTTREQGIIDLHEAGVPEPEICARMGLSPAYVRSRISHLCSNLGPTPGYSTGMIEGSRKLLGRIRQARGLA